MNVLLCDTCKTPIDGDAFEFHYIRGRAVPADQGRSRMIRSGQGRVMFLCDPCGRWINRAIDHLRAALVGV